MPLVERIQSWFKSESPFNTSSSSSSISSSSISPSVSADASYLFHSASSSPDDLQRRLELRDIFRDEQLFQQYLPYSKDPKDVWQQPGIRTWVDQWNSETQFIPMDSTRVFFSSVLSGLLVSVIATPFDVVKNYSIFSPQFRGTRTSISTKVIIKSLYEKRGIKGFYTGFNQTCIVLIPSNLLFFYCYEHWKYEAPPAIASVKARALASFLTLPWELARTKLQANIGERTPVELFNTAGTFNNASKGFLATMLRDAPFSAVYWTLNEKFKKQLERLDPSFDDRTMLRSRFVYPFISGASAAAIATTMTQPFDVIKTNIQGVDGWFKRRGGYFTNYNGFSSVAHVIWKTQGIKGFYVGLIPRLAKIIPSCSILLATYDFSKSLFTSDPIDFEIASC